MKKTLVVIVALLLLSVIASVTGADPDEERSATFVGSPFVEHTLNEDCADAIGEQECITRIPKGGASVFCDGGNGNPNTGGLYDGIGGVSFCGIPRGSLVELEFIAFTGALEAEATVSCPYSQTFENWDPRFGVLTSKEPVRLRVPLWCDDQLYGDPPDATQVLLVIHAANMGGPGIFAPLEGEIAIRILEGGP